MLGVRGCWLLARAQQVTRQVCFASCSATVKGSSSKPTNGENLVFTLTPSEGSTCQSGVSSLRRLHISSHIPNECMRSTSAAGAELYPSMQTGGPMLGVTSAPGQHGEYRLPTHSNTLYKKTILDPTAVKVLQLPSGQSVVLEKVTPPLAQVTPKIDPNPLQRVIDQGAPPLNIVCLPWLVTIRHKKMKKHKLKKLRKKMLFVRRKRKLFKRKRRELQIQAQERQFEQLAKEFDAEKFVSERMALARKGGWKVDPFVTHKQP